MKKSGRTSGTITALRAQKRRPDRVTAYLDGEFGFGLAAIEAARLRIGQTLSREDVEALADRDTAEEAYDRALGFLAYRPRSTREVRDSLSGAGVPVAVIDETVSRLERAGLVNDLEFARFWVQNREAFRPRSRFALRMELRGKGVDDSTIGEVLEGLDETASAIEAASARAQRLSTDDVSALREKLIPFLVRRGFSYAVADAAVSEFAARRGATE